MPTPTRSTTHRDIEPSRLASIGLEVEEAADEQAVSLALLHDLAGDRGRPVSHYVAATVLATELPFVEEHTTRAVFCAGKCQSWGALDCIDRAAEIWQEKGGFDLVAKTCLDRCEHAAVCEIRTEHGTAVITEATPEKVEEALRSVL
jgi:hypothetical protein